MPTSRPRHTITETDDVSDALALARRERPGERPGALLHWLIGLGRERLREAGEDARSRRLAALEETAGALDGVYPPGYLADLRREWPA